MDENDERQRVIEDAFTNYHSMPVRYVGVSKEINGKKIEKGQVFRIKLKKAVGFSYADSDSVTVFAMRMRDAALFEIEYRELASILYDWELA